jgi:hypothetical protein
MKSTHWPLRHTTLAASAPISLTSVDQAARGPGATAARLLSERIDGRSRSVLTSAAPQLTVRSTTGPPPNLWEPRAVHHWTGSCRLSEVTQTQALLG